VSVNTGPLHVDRVVTMHLLAAREACARRIR
jgi:hypothetical protein